jgi:hypothetical protein
VQSAIGQTGTGQKRRSNGAEKYSSLFPAFSTSPPLEWKSMQGFVAYYRVSTDRQGQSGLKCKGLLLFGVQH